MGRTFDGAGDKIDPGRAAALEITGDITISGWLRTTSTAATAILLCCYNPSTFVGYAVQLSIDGPNTGKLAYFNLANGGWRFSTSSTYNSGAWVQFAVRVIGTGAGAVNFFKNGSGDGTATQTAVAGTYTGNKRIGAVTDDSFCYSGDLAHLAVHNVGLTDFEILELARGGSPFRIRKASLAGYWPLYGVHSPEPDFSGNGYSGTVTGTTATVEPPMRPFRFWRPSFVDVAPSLPSFRIQAPRVRPRPFAPGCAR